MATEQDHVWAMLDDMLVFLSKRHVPTPERTYKLDGGWTLAMDDLRRFVDTLTAEREQLSAEVDKVKEQRAYWESAAVEMRGYKEAAERERDEAQAHAEDLRGALEAYLSWQRARADFDLIFESEDEECSVEDVLAVDAAKLKWVQLLQSSLARTPAKSLDRLKAEALLEAAKKIDGECCDCHDECKQDLLDEAGRLESKNG